MEQVNSSLYSIPEKFTVYGPRLKQDRWETCPRAVRHAAFAVACIAVCNSLSDEMLSHRIQDALLGLRWTSRPPRTCGSRSRQAYIAVCNSLSGEMLSMDPRSHRTQEKIFVIELALLGIYELRWTCNPFVHVRSQHQLCYFCSVPASASRLAFLQYSRLANFWLGGTARSPTQMLGRLHKSNYMLGGPAYYASAPSAVEKHDFQGSGSLDNLASSAPNPSYTL